MQKEKTFTSCARCGNCTVVCPVFGVTKNEAQSARGRMHLLSLPLAESPSSRFEDVFSSCLLCGACESACPRQLPIRDLVIESRARFSLFYGSHGVEKHVVRKVLSRQGLLAGLVKAGISIKKLNALPKDSGLRRKLGLLEESRTAPGGQPGDRISGRTGVVAKEVAYFSGCLASHLQPSIHEATRDLVGRMTESQLSVPLQQQCCGLAAQAAGALNDARKLARQNILAFAGTSGPILTSCASCSAQLQEYSSLFRGDPKWERLAMDFSQRITEFSAFFSGAMKKCTFSALDEIRVFYHDPCHLRFGGNDVSNPRDLLDRIECVTRVEGEASCCGQGGLFHLGYPELSLVIFSRSQDAALEENPDIVTTTCSGCLMQWQQGFAGQNSRVEVMHLAVLLRRLLLGEEERRDPVP